MRGWPDMSARPRTLAKGQPSPTGVALGVPLYVATLSLAPLSPAPHNYLLERSFDLSSPPKTVPTLPGFILCPRGHGQGAGKPPKGVPAAEIVKCFPTDW